MGSPRPSTRAMRRRFGAPQVIDAVFLAVLVLAGAGCGGGDIQLPPARPIVVFSGERLRVEPARMDSIYGWLQDEVDQIELDPTFLIAGVPTVRETLPWETLTIEGDTARIQYDRAHPDVVTPFNIYAHLHLMDRMGRLDEWLPDHVGASGFDLERAIVGRVADAWLLGRAVFDAPAYGPLDELMYASEAGYLDPYLLFARPEEFAEEKAAWEQAHPGGGDEYREWFMRTFDTEPRGMREETGGGQ